MTDPSTSTASQSLTGRVLAGRYLLGKLIGQGGMGSVYQAHDQQMSNRVVAIKILALHLVGDDKQVARFEQEARAANQLGHPNTISVLDFGQSDGLLYMVMEFLSGETLTQVLRRGRLPLQRALYMARQVLKSLAEAHSKGIIHRDLKPDNIFVCEIYGEKDFIKVIDFGIAKFLASGGQELTQAGKMFGTPRYLSPEQAQGLPLTPASDLYALGVILFEMIAGRPPFVADDPIAVAIKHVQERAPRMADVAPELELPAAVDDFVAHLLTKKAIDRYQSAEEVLDAMEDVLALSGTAFGAGALGGARLPTGQHREQTGQVRAPGFSSRTPARPVTVPPASKSPTDPGQSELAANADADDATMALRVPTPAAAVALPDAGPGGAEPALASPEDRTRALPTTTGTPARPATPVAAAAQATLALSEADVAALRPAAAPSTPATKAAQADASPAAAPPARSKGWIVGLVGLAALAGLAAMVVRGGATSAVEAPAAIDPARPAEAQATVAATPPEAAAPAPEAASAAAAANPAPEPAAPTAVQAPAAAPAPQVADPAAAPDVLTLEVDSDPKGALVVIDGIDLGPTPQKLKLRKGVAQKVLLKLPGYLDEVLETDKLYNVATLMAEQERKVQQKLRPKPVVRPVKKPTGKPEVQW